MKVKNKTHATTHPPHTHQIFLGGLRDAEVERVHERLSGAAMETALAMAAFRTDATPASAARFALLALAKVLHWLAADRVGHLESAGAPRPRDAARLAALLALLLAVDSAALSSSLDAALAAPDGVASLFAFECVVLASTAASTAVKAGLAGVDRAMGGGWDGRGVASIYVDLTTDTVHLIVYAAFFAAVAAHHGVPLHLLRDLAATAASLHRRAAAFLAYRRAAASLDAALDGATAQDVSRCGGVCIVCRDEMEVGGEEGARSPTSKVLRCGHAFHVRCLRSWLERQQACPICRAPVLPAPPVVAPPPPPAATPQPPPPAEAAPGAFAGAAAAGLRQRHVGGQPAGGGLAAAAAGVPPPQPAPQPAAAGFAAPPQAPASAPAVAIFLPAGFPLAVAPAGAVGATLPFLPVASLGGGGGGVPPGGAADPAVARQLAELASLLAAQAQGGGVAPAAPPAAQPTEAAAAPPPPPAAPAPAADDDDTDAVRRARLARFAGAE